MKTCPKCGSDNVWPANDHQDICIDCSHIWDADNSTRVPIDMDRIGISVDNTSEPLVQSVKETPEWKEPLPPGHKARTELDTRIEAATFRLDAIRCGWPDSVGLRIRARDMAQELWDMRIVDRNQQRRIGAEVMVDNLRKLCEDDIEEPADTVIDIGW